ncbi:hypothetical protein [Microbacterium jepli]
MKQPQRRALTWAVIGALVLVAGVVAIVVGAISAAPAPTASPAASPTGPDVTPSFGPSTTPSTGSRVVDESVRSRGWVPEPITAGRAVYVQAALEAAATFDTQKSSRAEWLDYLDTWFTPDTRYTSEADRQKRLAAAQLELRQAVVLPDQQWTSLANERGRVAATVTTDISWSTVPEDASGDMSIGTADVLLTYTRQDNTGTETTYEESTRVSVQVLCGPGSVPVPDTSQSPGDCRVVRYFAEPIEP